MATECRCPECGAALNLERNVRIEEDYVPKYPRRNATTLPRRIRIGLVAFCSGCEFVHEVR